MKILILVVALALMPESAMARKYAWEPGYDRAVAEREDAEAEERQLRMKLMEEQREAIREQREALEDQRRMMRSQDLRNDLQSLEMLGGRSGGLPPIGY